METAQEIIFKKRTGITFKEFYTKYRPKLVWYVSRSFFNKNITEDIVTETFLQLLETIEAFDIKKSKLSTWLFNITNNHIKAEYNNIYKTNIISFDNESSDGETFERYLGLPEDTRIEENEERAIKDTKLKLIKEAIYSIPEKDDKCKEIMIMRVLQNLKYTEISQYFGIGMSDVKNNIRKGRKIVQNKVCPIIKNLQLC